MSRLGFYKKFKKPIAPMVDVNPYGEMVNYIKDRVENIDNKVFDLVTNYNLLTADVTTIRKSMDDLNKFAKYTTYAAAAAVLILTLLIGYAVHALPMVDIIKSIFLK